MERISDRRPEKQDRADRDDVFRSEKIEVEKLHVSASRRHGAFGRAESHAPRADDDKIDERADQADCDHIRKGNIDGEAFHETAPC